MKTWLGKFLKNSGSILLIFVAVWLFRGWYMTPDVGNGEMAEDFSALAIDGTEFKLSGFRGQYVLLQFWGSWCGPCRRQNPQLVATAKQLGNQLIPISIAIEKDSSRWQKAIRQDGLYWPHHVMDATTSVKFLNGPISNLYGVNQVPTDFLIGPDGKVIAVDPAFTDIVRVVKGGLQEL